MKLTIGRAGKFCTGCGGKITGGAAVDQKPSFQKPQPVSRSQTTGAIPSKPTSSVKSQAAAFEPKPQHQQPVLKTHSQTSVKSQAAVFEAKPQPSQPPVSPKPKTNFQTQPALSNNSGPQPSKTTTFKNQTSFNSAPQLSPTQPTKKVNPPGAPKDLTKENCYKCKRGMQPHVECPN